MRIESDRFITASVEKTRDDLEAKGQDAHTVELLLEQLRYQLEMVYHRHYVRTVEWLESSDVDERQQMNQDKKSIREWQKLLSQAEDLRTTLEDLWPELSEFLFDEGHAHSAVGKLLLVAVIIDALVDLFLENNYPEEISRNLLATIELTSLRSPDENIAMVSAFLTRLEYKTQSLKKEQQKRLTPFTFEEMVSGNETLQQKTVALLATSDVLFGILAHHHIEFPKKLPSIPVLESEKDGQKYPQPEYEDFEGDPGTVVILAPGWVPSDGKLLEAARAGIPNQHGELEQRLPSLLVGVIADNGNEGSEKTESASSHFVAQRQFYYVSANPLRPLHVEDPALHLTLLRRSEAMRNLSFDALSYTGGIRLVRFLYEKISVGVEKDEDLVLSSRQAKNVLEQCQKAITNWFNDIEAIFPLVVKNFHQKYHWHKEIDEIAAKDMIRFNMLQLAFESRYGEVVVRRPADIIDLYRERFIKSELLYEDKAALMKTFLAGNPVEKWRVLDLPQELEQGLVELKRRDQLDEIPQEVLFKLTEYLDKILVARMETIRDFRPE